MRKLRKIAKSNYSRKTPPSLILGVTGGIAVYKALELLRLFQAEGFDSWVVMTENAQRFVSPLSFQTFTNHPVITSLFDNPLIHIELQEKDLLIIAPATANIIAKIAHGICDDTLSTITCAFSGIKILVPAMNTLMWENPLVQENIKKLKSLNYHIIPPQEGKLASGDWGKGRMPEPEEILSFVKSIFWGMREEKILSGLKILITAGRTEEDIDVVRVITNRSSGRLGKELAEEARALGANCLLIAGRMEERPKDIPILSVRTAQEILSAIKKEIKNFDVLIMTAAVGDYKPAHSTQKKIKKRAFSLPLVKNIDILKSLAGEKIFKVGFSLDSEEEMMKEAKRKLKEKKLDLICANPPSALEGDFIKPTLFYRDGKIEVLPEMTKKEFASLLLKKIKNQIS
ncbi:MAG: bifunctional phosphopantothenoylcysteine decarboxylase/phosphopantothenate--cysteine ligase CoaBC [candidate division WOR-3 bacterium]